MKKLIAFSIAALASISACAQSVWSRQHLDHVKAHLNRPMYAMAYDALLNRAEALLDSVPLSVMMKELPSPSGNNHDYTSLARYYHPDPSKPEGFPYINRDGITNPQIALYDRTRLGETAERVSDLALAWYLSGDERYAAKATELLDTWFLEPATRMNPNFEYAQIAPGHNGNKGRCYGVLDGYSFIEMLDGVALLKGSRSWTPKKDRHLRKWMGDMLQWMLTSPQGIEERNQKNNHSVAYDAQAIALAMYSGKPDVAHRIINEFPSKRIFTQIDPDGKQPHEMKRTLSYHYSQYNITHFIDIFLMARKLGLSIDSVTDAEGRSFYKALDFLASYLGKEKDEWPGEQISGWDGKQQEVARDLWRVYSMLDSTRTDYAKVYQQYRIFNPSDKFILLYYTPDDVDDAFAKASQSFRYAINRVNEEKRKPDNAVMRKVSPRTVNSDGSLALVHPHDWTSGFFPGELWMIYEFTHDPFWREQAVSFTWPIEEAKWHGGTHDLGFMIGNSFGKAWELTGECSYFDVVRRSAETLCTRFNPTVGAIRSWDHNRDKWKYPVIIDNMMNLEMLFKMAEATGDKKFREIAVNHADVTLKNHFRPDCSSYHVVDYDPADGSVRMKITHQGYADDSFWSRGQGWGLYGYTMCYRFTGDERYLSHARSIADWFLNLPNMPEDMVPYWDMKAPGTERSDNPDVPRDASAAALIASGLYELAGYVDADRMLVYRKAADNILSSLSSDEYSADSDELEGFLLRHSTGHYPAGSEIDVPLVYADYYYLEALLRKRYVKIPYAAKTP